jgi:hypothetical protein
MKFTILIPHYKAWKITTYAIHQFLKFRGRHEIDIIVVDNFPQDGSAEKLKVFGNQITLLTYPQDKLQSHGIGFDFCMSHVKTEYFITAESDSFPTVEGWLDYYEGLINSGLDCAGSVLKLSGGEYMHPAGALYKTKTWHEAKAYCDSIQYTYFPSIAEFHGFSNHLMVHKRVLDKFISDPPSYVILNSSYQGLSEEAMLKRAEDYSPVVGPFHNGMGNLHENIHSYGSRTIQSEAPWILLNNQEPLIYRMGYEPGQWLCYWQIAMGKQLGAIPTSVVWMPGRVGQQQDFTIMDNGFKHLWAVSSYHDATDKNMMDVIKRKRELANELYESLPEEIKTPL